MVTVHTDIGSPGFSVDFLSDIHVEWWRATEVFDYAAHKKNDIVIVGGDLRSDTRESLEELEKIAAVYGTVLFIDGNNEFRSGAPDYRYNLDFDAVEETLREGIAAIPNVVYLRDEPFVKDGVAIIGRNGHWDYQMIGSVPEEEAIEAIASRFKMTFNEAASFSGLARRDYEALREQVIALNQDSSIHTIVVVTHTVPRSELLDLSGKYPAVSSARMGSSLMRDLPAHDTEGKIKLWLFGHAHAPHQQEIDGILYHENPRGEEKDGHTNYRPSRIRFSPPTL